MEFGFTTAVYVVAAILFILSLGGLSGEESAKRAVWYGIVGMALAVVATLIGPGSGLWLLSVILIAGGGVNHSVLGNRVYIDDGATVEDSILFSDVRVGEGAQMRRCICDRSVTIPPGEQIGIDSAEDAKRFTVTESGVVVIPSDYTFD